MTTLLTIDDLDVGGKRVLVRADLNVPLDGPEVSDDFRLRAALPTIERLRAEGAVVIVCSHLGRPKGQVDEALSMKPVAEALSALGGFAVNAPGQLVGPAAREACQSSGPGDVVLLENTRFEPGETKNDPELGVALAGLADYFVVDGFGTAHRSHASTVGVAAHLPSAAGLLLQSELAAFRSLLEDPPRPFTVVLGGAKISDKLPVIQALLPIVDTMLIGGGMCFTVLAAEGYEVGTSLTEPDQVDVLRDVLASEYGERIVLPSDLMIADRFGADAEHRAVPVSAVDDDWMGLDIGPETSAQFAHSIRGSRSVFWNGPMGVFEWPEFRSGTEAVAQAVAASEAFTVVGGGDSVAALRLLGLAESPSHLSTGGGAGLALLQGKALPVVTALQRWAQEGG